eukprot:TRINITY_DN7542_c0_g2_i2.p1 TRINITY_DN7542_c0_g2~~TRINITY_DN7542_c0_g2_i2.p1  ORF type:complete len:515 (+),score=82.18 TRINITY_DN7542_c0_g2_i2:73-1545(+)
MAAAEARRASSVEQAWSPPEAEDSPPPQPRWRARAASPQPRRGVPPPQHQRAVARRRASAPTHALPQPPPHRHLGHSHTAAPLHPAPWGAGGGCRATAGSPRFCWSQQPRRLRQPAPPASAARAARPPESRSAAQLREELCRSLAQGEGPSASITITAPGGGEGTLLLRAAEWGHCSVTLNGAPFPDRALVAAARWSRPEHCLTLAGPGLGAGGCAFQLASDRPRELAAAAACFDATGVTHDLSPSAPGAADAAAAVAAPYSGPEWWLRDLPDCHLSSQEVKERVREYATARAQGWLTGSSAAVALKQALRDMGVAIEGGSDHERWRTQDGRSGPLPYVPLANPIDLLGSAQLGGHEDPAPREDPSPPPPPPPPPEHGGRPRGRRARTPSPRAQVSPRPSAGRCSPSPRPSTPQPRRSPLRGGSPRGGTPRRPGSPRPAAPAPLQGRPPWRGGGWHSVVPRPAAAEPPQPFIARSPRGMRRRPGARLMRC